MNFWDIVLTIGLIFLVAGAICSTIRYRKKGGCCGDCSQCHGCDKKNR